MVLFALEVVFLAPTVSVLILLINVLHFQLVPMIIFVALMGYVLISNPILLQHARLSHSPSLPVLLGRVDVKMVSVVLSVLFILAVPYQLPSLAALRRFNV